MVVGLGLLGEEEGEEEEGREKKTREGSVGNLVVFYSPRPFHHCPVTPVWLPLRPACAGTRCDPPKLDRDITQRTAISSTTRSRGGGHATTLHLAPTERHSRCSISIRNGSIPKDWKPAGIRRAYRDMPASSQRECVACESPATCTQRSKRRCRGLRRITGQSPRRCSRLLQQGDLTSPLSSATSVTTAPPVVSYRRVTRPSCRIGPQ